MQMCKEEPKEICCKTKQGFVWTSEKKCEHYGYSVVSDKFCESDPEPVIVCCETANGPVLAPADKCKAAGYGLLPMEMCKEEPKEICCKSNQGPVWASAQKCKDKGFAIIPDKFCEQTTDEVCCDLPGQPSLVPASMCPECAVLPFNVCQGEPPADVCCKTKSGFLWLPGNECPDSQVVSNKYCEDTTEPGICDDGIYGQCLEQDFDYTAQCNPKGFDCTSFAILGDKNCDGKYDVCIECPAGTAPVDTNGDGCEDACDCVDDPKPTFSQDKK